MSDDFGRLTCNQLKLELSKRDARVSGTKEVLLERLRAYERNQDFISNGPVLNISDDHNYSSSELGIPNWPNSASFRTITRDQQFSIPQVSMEHLHQYIMNQQGYDSRSISDNKSLRKGKLLSEESVVAISMFLETSRAFITGTVNASMKKRLSYSVKVIFETSGEIKMSHCECPGRIGPNSTCKHIIAIILVLVDFQKTGEIKISKSCTETLQSFHRPRQSHVGSPVRAEKLGKKLSELDDDPRPLHLRNRASFNDEVLMKVVNFTYTSNSNIAMRYLIPKANIDAASLDHSYLAKDFRTY